MARSLLSAHGWLYVSWSTLDLPDDCPICSAFDGAIWWTVEELGPFANHMDEGHPQCTAEECGCSFVIVHADEVAPPIDVYLPSGLPQDIYDFIRGRN